MKNKLKALCKVSVKKKPSRNDAFYPLGVADSKPERHTLMDFKSEPDGFMRDLDSILGIRSVDPVVESNDAKYFVPDESSEIIHDVSLSTSNTRDLFDAYGFHDEAVRMEKAELAATDTVAHYRVECDKYLVHLKDSIFCRPTCPARKPKFENCEFFETVKEALLASFRPCQRCQSLSHPNQVSAIIRTLVKAVEDNPEKRWKEQDFRKLSIDVSTARRQFKKRFGMTFVEYARARRMGLALKHIKKGNTVIDAQLSTGYESSSGFRDAFSRIMGAPPSQINHLILKAAWLDTKLGPMIAIADENGLYLLEFIDRRGLEREVEFLRKKLKAAIIPGETKIIKSIESEIANYFEGKNLIFNTPIHLIGSPFKKRVWAELRTIPSGETRSYLKIAESIKTPTAFRAVARANGANSLAIIVPCHRVINTNGELGGYGGGVVRKEWLLEHEKKYAFLKNKIK